MIIRVVITKFVPVEAVLSEGEGKRKKVLNRRSMAQEY